MRLIEPDFLYRVVYHSYSLTQSAEICYFPLQIFAVDGAILLPLQIALAGACLLPLQVTVARSYLRYFASDGAIFLPLQIAPAGACLLPLQVTVARSYPVI